ncbi:unnamed protein product [Caenorhabditis auriculariae]|uniref:Uncharacterized protein n=1 Tax=Caenorhabditis auriculariae TaxID=2777116 RepID=A0A8S1GTI6_9PELO|nr:unnamed protein product [Caenorhabditis auriculariae]
MGDRYGPPPMSRDAQTRLLAVDELLPIIDRIVNQWGSINMEGLKMEAEREATKMGAKLPVLLRSPQEWEARIKMLADGGKINAVYKDGTLRMPGNPFRSLERQEPRNSESQINYVRFLSSEQYEGDVFKSPRWPGLPDRDRKQAECNLKDLQMYEGAPNYRERDYGSTSSQGQRQDYPEESRYWGRDEEEEDEVEIERCRRRRKQLREEIEHLERRHERYRNVPDRVFGKTTRSGVAVCSYCNSYNLHVSDGCPKIRRTDSRWRLAEEQRRCGSCLRFHQPPCHEKQYCGYCRVRISDHHHSLCPLPEEKADLEEKIDALTKELRLWY